MSKIICFLLHQSLPSTLFPPPSCQLPKLLPSLAFTSHSSSLPKPLRIRKTPKVPLTRLLVVGILINLISFLDLILGKPFPVPVSYEINEMVEWDKVV
jgi:hypothetical protein